MSFDLEYFSGDSSDVGAPRFRETQEAIWAAEELITEYLKEHKRAPTDRVRDYVEEQFKSSGVFKRQHSYYCSTCAIWSLVGRKTIRIDRSPRGNLLVWNCD